MSVLNVLLIDNEQELLEVAALLLRRQGAQVFTATSFKAGEEILAMNKIHLIISDYHLPEGNGEDWLYRLRLAGEEALFMIYTGSFDLEEKNFPALEKVLRTVVKTDLAGLVEAVDAAREYWALDETRPLIRKQGA